MKVLLTGSTGQLGRALLASRPTALDLIAPGRDELDLSDATSIHTAVRRIAPQAIINAGAYTAVDKAESQREIAFAINAEGPAVLARYCADAGARLLQVSTDFVFDGARGSPYPPDAPTNPLSVYGASKRRAEEIIATTADLHWQIVRTAWVYAAEGRNFMLTMLRLFRERPAVNVVCDQIGTPTSASSLARCVWRILDDGAAQTIFHYTDAGVASWYDFAVAIYEEARALGLLANIVQINPIATRQYQTPARRPAYSVLDKRSSIERLQLQPNHWRVELRKVLRETRI